MASIHDRWNEHLRIDLRRLLSNTDSSPSPFGVTDEGLWDFRGICVNASLHSVTIVNVDFTDGMLGRGQLMGSFRNCKFVEFACDGTLGESFEECIFHKANLSKSVWYGKFTNCDFSNANLTGVRGGNVKFEGCTFENADMRKASFYDSKFNNCTLVNCSIRLGSLAGSRFDECKVIDFDVSKTIMERVKGLFPIQ